MIGGIYMGFFTPTEGAAIGAAGTGLIATFNKNFNFLSFLDVIESTAITSGMIFLVLLGAEFLILLLHFPTSKYFSRINHKTSINTHDSCG